MHGWNGPLPPVILDLHTGCCPTPQEELVIKLIERHWSAVTGMTIQLFGMV